MGAIAAIVGGLAVAGVGAGLSASEASSQRKAMRKLAKTPFLDPTKYQGEALAAGKLAIPSLVEIGAQINAFNQSQLLSMNRAAIPGFDAIMGQGSKSILSMLKGELPSDVSEAVTRGAASRAVSGGFGGSGAHRNLVLRDLGLTSLQTMQQGLSAAERWIQMAAATSVPALFNPAAFLLTPAQTYQGALTQRGQNMGVGQTAALTPGGGAALGGFLAAVGGQTAGAGAKAYFASKRHAGGTTIYGSEGSFPSGNAITYQGTV